MILELDEQTIIELIRLVSELEANHEKSIEGFKNLMELHDMMPEEFEDEFQKMNEAVESWKKIKKSVQMAYLDAAESEQIISITKVEGND